MLIPEQINILYIEDDEPSSVTTLKYLKKAIITKFNVVHMCTLKEGLDYLENECKEDGDCNIDVILLDLILPNSHGIATYQSVVDKYPYIPVVIISGHQEMAFECVRLGAQDYLYKPDYNGGTLTRSLMYAIERDRLETLRLEAESKYKNVIESTPLGFHSYELINGKLIFVGYNPAADCILKTSNEKYMGKCIKSAFPLLADTEIPEKYLEVLKSGKTWKAGIIEYEDDNVKNANFRVNVFKTGKNCITASFEDVTEQIKIDEKYKNLVEITKAGMYEIDFIQNKFVYVNDVICKQLGYTREELMSKGPYDILTKESIDKWFQRWEALQKGEFIENSFEYEAVRKDGSKAWALITAEYIEDKHKNVIGANVVAIDITDKVLAERESKQKEEFMFNELESRIQQWRTELDQNVVNNQGKIQTVDMYMPSLDDIEVI